MNPYSSLRFPRFGLGSRLFWGNVVATLLLRSPTVLAQGEESNPSTTDDTGPTGLSSTGAPTHAVTPPRLVRFEPATYPAQAEREGLEADVILALSIDATGQVTSVAVREGAGHGFDEAATVAAQKFIFEPAKRAGTAVASKILYRYGFKLDAKPKATEAAPVQRQGALGGRIVAGTPPAALAGVAVRIRGKDGAPISLITAADGTWSAPELTPGDYQIEVEAAGYRHVQQIERVESNRATQVTYHLEWTDESTIEVTVRGAAIRREVSHHQIDRTELIRVPGTFGDTIHAVEAMPSVARPFAFSGDLIVRGSSPQDTQVFVDGTLIPAVFHYGGIASVIPSEMVERLEFYPGNFSVRYGRGMGGIVEVGLRQTNPDGKYHGSAQVDFINARANVEGPIPLARGWSFMAGARMTYLDRWLAPVLRSSGSGLDGLPRYYDYQFRVERRLPNNGIYQVGLFGASDSYVPIAKDPGWRSPDRAFGYLQSLLRLPLTDSLDLKASWSLGRHVNNEPGDDHRSYKTTYNLATFRAELALKTGSLGIARLGTDVQYAPFKFRAISDSPTQGGEQSMQGTSTAQLELYDIRAVHLRPGAFIEYELAPTRRFNVTTGLRMDYTRDTDEVAFSPRASGRYVLTEGPHGTLLKGGVGLFRQPPDPGQTLPRFGTPELNSSYALHTMLGLEQSLSRHVSLSVEGFHKSLRDLVSSTRDGSGQYFLNNAGTGRVLGADFLLRYKADERFFGWISYTYSRSFRTLDPDQPERIYRFDQPHILNVLASYRLGRGWEIGGRFRYMSGFIYNAYEGGLYNNATGWYGFYGEQLQKRLAPFHQLDLRVEKVWRVAGGQLSAYMDLINVYNRESPDRPRFSFDRSMMRPQSFSLPILPSLGIRGEI